MILCVVLTSSVTFIYFQFIRKRQFQWRCYIDCWCIRVENSTTLQWSWQLRQNIHVPTPRDREHFESKILGPWVLYPKSILQKVRCGILLLVHAFSIFLLWLISSQKCSQWALQHSKIFFASAWQDNLMQRKLWGYFLGPWYFFTWSEWQITLPWCFTNFVWNRFKIDGPNCVRCDMARG